MPNAAALNTPTPAHPGVLYGEVLPAALRPSSLHALFEAAADAHPQRPALVQGDLTLSYAEVERRANTLARTLRARGIGRGSRVALLMERTPAQYVALLAVLKAGGAYVPLDPESPADRVAYILSDSGAALLLTDGELLGPPGAAPDGFGGSVLHLGRVDDELACFSSERPGAGEWTVSPDDEVYVIYTSGTTGRPKGVLLRHRNAAQLVRASQHLYRVTPGDRVYQGFTLAFDASVEEIWMALGHGAALVCGTQAQTRAGADLPALLTASGVTALSCVPTLLSLFQGDLPGVRLLIVGGEACPASLVARWATPGRRMLNTYGPTEATVIATAAELRPGAPVTIGRPVPNYHAWVRGEDGAALLPGEEGELVLGGPGIAAGYLNRPELTDEKFIPDPFAPGERAYRSGDLVRVNAAGEIEYLGRIDTQVKLRGFRVELSEIEAVLMDVPGVQAAAAAVHEGAPGLPVLAAYVVPAAGERPDLAAAQALLRERLPAYMRPGVLEVIAALPSLPSGKLDRKKLPAPTGAPLTAEGPYVAPVTGAERRMAAAWAGVFGRERVSVGAHFFHDLGGHSLFAAHLVSQLRQDPAWAHLSVSDLYAHPTVRALAALPAPAAAGEDLERAEPVSGWRRALTASGQAAGVYATTFFLGLPFLLVYQYLAGDWFSGRARDTLLILGLLVALYFPGALLLALAGKWLLIGRYRPGRHRLWGGYFLRWWLARTFMSVAPLDALAGTPLLPAYLRLLGARVGRDVHLGSANLGAPDLLTLGDGSSVGQDASLTGHRIERGWLILGPVTLGAGAYVGTNAVLSPDSALGAGASLAAHSLLPPGVSVPAGESWSGAPARPAAPDPVIQALRESAAPRPARARHLRQALTYTALIAGVLAAEYAVTLSFSFLLIHRLSVTAWALLWLPPLLALGSTLVIAALPVLARALLLPRLRPGTVSVTGSLYLRAWLFEQFYGLNLAENNSLHGTVYFPPLLRLLGARVGRMAEVSTATHALPPLLSLGRDSFLADAVSIGAPKVHGGQMHLAHTVVGDGSFVGNSACVDAGTVIGREALIGVLSVPPRAPAPGMAFPGDRVPDDSNWLGAPALHLPARHVQDTFGRADTHRPTPGRWALRLAVEGLRVLLPKTINFVKLGALLFLLWRLEDLLPLPLWLLSYPLALLVTDVAATLVVAAIKWLVVGRYTPDEAPLWSPRVWLSELVTGLYEDVVVGPVIDKLAGTPFVNPVLRLFGTRIGRRVYMDSSYLSEWDLVTVGDDASVGQDTTLQTHLFEDRVMKMDHLTIGEGCSVGDNAVVLYSTRMEPGSRLGSLSLLMKGETLPAGTAWEGVPARPPQGVEGAAPAASAALPGPLPLAGD